MNKLRSQNESSLQKSSMMKLDCHLIIAPEWEQWSKQNGSFVIPNTKTKQSTTIVPVEDKIAKAE